MIPTPPHHPEGLCIKERTDAKIRIISETTKDLDKKIALATFHFLSNSCLFFMGFMYL